MIVVIGVVLCFSPDPGLPEGQPFHSDDGVWCQAATDVADDLLRRLAHKHHVVQLDQLRPHASEDVDRLGPMVDRVVDALQDHVA